MDETLVEVKVRVTARDIYSGIPESCSLCPVALALNRLLADEYEANVDLSYCIIQRKDRRWGNPLHEFSFPNSVYYFILRYDDTGRGSPFTFKMRLPKKYLKITLMQRLKTWLTKKSKRFV